MTLVKKSVGGKNCIMNYFRPIQNKVKHAAQVEVIDIEARAIDGKLGILVEEKYESSLLHS